MTCFFPCGGAVLKTEGTSAQPTAVAPPPARQLGPAGEPAMPAPSGQGAAASPGQVRLRGDPPNGRRVPAVGLPAGQAAQTKATRETGSGAARGSLLQAAVPACLDARPGRRLSSERRLRPQRLRPSAPRPRPRPPGRDGERRRVRGGACRRWSPCLGERVCASVRAGRPRRQRRAEEGRSLGEAPSDARWRSRDNGRRGHRDKRGTGTGGQRGRGPTARGGDSAAKGQRSRGRDPRSGGGRGRRAPSRALSGVLTPARWPRRWPGRCPGC